MGLETTEKSMKDETETLIETAVDENGEVLWSEPYKFSRLSAPDELMTWNGISCRVISSVKTGTQIKTVVHVIRRLTAKTHNA